MLVFSIYKPVIVREHEKFATLHIMCAFLFLYTSEVLEF